MQIAATKIKVYQAIEKSLIRFAWRRANLMKYCVLQQVSFPFSKYEEKGKRLPTLVKESFRTYAQYPQTEYLFRVTRPTLIEAKFGWASFQPNYLIYESIPYCEDMMLPKPSFFGMRKGWQQISVELDSCISIFFHWGNYWHLYNDVFGQLMLCDEYGVPPDTPILVPERAMEYEPFKQLIACSDYLKARVWVILKDGYFARSKQVWFAKNLPNVKKHFESFIGHIDLPKGNVQIHEKIFVNRSASRIRHIINFQELVPILAKFNIAIIDADQMGIAEQINKFSNASFICGIHGAGLSNIIFVKNSTCHLLEIFPPDSIPPHYFWLSAELGFSYDAIVGSTEYNNGFTVDIGLLERKFNEILG